MERIIKDGSGWRLGWDSQASEYQGLVAGDGWAIELTEAELDDFCRLLSQLAQTMSEMATELMDEEKITCEAESNLLWMEVEGYPEEYSLRFILNTGRCCEGSWPAPAVKSLLQGAWSLKVF
ncbi:MAG: DUF1818 family protein [Symploca sp. SIO3C6]|uniref:DUF1818 family protein n=1 Tax=Symploca sp. SIO1C4 TaxID=2607765 RepID=A0A6B3NJW0_9CYAN|nr:DUF1818 family protein [Symploca sp. SIO3C6]NER29891.1 DUF1818 family protein [Symploca sp. SIO1C4]NET04355.1 DUF1818 family protein [Symploca sp. SIO2B6]NET47215.1 DUF1818 family protein [Merismopedia sp. SIO2A8]